MRGNSIFLVLFFMVCANAISQENALAGDNLFYSYAYAEAVKAYEKDVEEGTKLSPKQRLNLADSYFKTNSFDKASTLYVALFKNDSVMNSLQFNRMLQSLVRNEQANKLDSIFDEKKNELPRELIENADFNINLIKNGTEGELKFDIFNLEANSAQSDFSASFYKEGILFASARPNSGKSKYLPSDESYLDIFEGDIEASGQVPYVTFFKDLKGSEYHKATPYFSEKLQSTFYIYSNTDEEGELAYDEKGKNSLAMGIKKVGGKFFPLMKDLSTSFYYPCYDEPTGRLYFAADFKDGYGGTDLYYVHTNNGQIMSAPINLGPRINSPGNEIAPFIFEKSLYFSSDIFYGLGGMDIYKSNVQPDGFSIPINLGTSINTEKDEFGFIIKNYGDGLLGYFSSNRGGGKGKDDIYGFLIDEKPGFQTFALKGRVVNVGQSKGVPEAVVQILNTENELLQEVVSDANGRYSVEVPWENGIRIRATKNRHSIFSIDFDEPQMKLVQQDELNLGLTFYDDIVEEREGQKIIKLKKFYFGKGKTNITPEIAIELDKVVDAVTRFPNIQLRVETHTDSRGGSSTNFRLTQARSDNIKKYLIRKGVPSSNILYSIGYGEQKILNDCKNGVFCIDYLHKENQRSLIVVLNDNVLFE